MRIFLYLILTIICTYGCGFKIVNQSEGQKFYISEIITSGDNKINFDLKNKLINKNNDLNKRKIDLNIKSKKNREIKEKNSKNEITKYLVTINLLINISDESQDTETINLTDQIDYNVSAQSSQTNNAEKEAIKLLTNRLANRLLRELSILYNNDL